MTSLSRRNLLATSVLVPAGILLANCSGTSTASAEAQMLADAAGVLSAIKSVATAVNTYDPAALPAAVLTQIVASVVAAQGIIGSLSGASAPAPTATTLVTLDTYINNGLQAIAAVLPAASVAFPVLVPFVMPFDAAVSLLPAIEAYINPIITQVTGVQAHAPITPIKNVYSAVAARALLNVAVVH